MIIHQPDVTHRDGEVRVSARLEFNDKQGYALPNQFWFSVPEAYESFVTDRIDPFVTALFSVAMLLNEPLEVRGVMSSRLGFGLQQIQRAYHYWQPKHLHIIDITPEGYAAADPVHSVAEHTALTFSGGVDSFFTLRSLLEDRAPADPLPTQAIFFRRMDVLARDDAFAEHLEARYTDMLQALDVELIALSSNWQHTIDIHYKRLHHDAFSLGLMLGAAGQLLERGISTLILPSNMDYDSYIPSSFYHSIVPLYSTEKVTVYDHGSHARREHKVRSIAGWQPVRDNLRVCFRMGNTETKQLNCCHCNKCVSTMLVLEAMGLLDSFTAFPEPLNLRAMSSMVYSGGGRMSRQMINATLPDLMQEGRPGLVVSVKVILWLKTLYRFARNQAVRVRNQYRERVQRRIEP